MGSLSRDMLRNYVRAKLGRDIVRVELSDAQIDACVQDAVRLFNMYLPLHGMRVLPNSTTSRHNMSALVPGIQSVISVTGTRSRTYNATYDRLDLFDPLVYLAGAAPAVSGIASYWQGLEMLQQARRVFGSEVEWYETWEHNEQTNQRELALYVQVGENTRQQLGCEYLVALTPDDDPRTGLRCIPSDMEKWTTDYVLAQAKTVLGRALRKFQGIPSPEGADMALDGQELAAEGDTAIERLESQIKNMRKTFPPIVS